MGDVIYEQSDNNPMGHSTLYVPEASVINDYNGLLENTSQVKGGVDGTEQGQWGKLEGVHLDGAYVYGKVAGSPAYQEAEDKGWLESFDRWLLHLPGGHFWVDNIVARADRGPVSAAETWVFNHAPFEDEAQACKYNELHVEVTRTTTTPSSFARLA